MPKITYIQPNGHATSIELGSGMSVMQGAVTNGIDGILGECGGGAMCATCHVYVDPTQIEQLPLMTEGEDALLDGTASDRLPNSRLSCQIMVAPNLDGLVVTLPDRQV